MRAISEKRRIIEAEGHQHKVQRGQWGTFHYENLRALKSLIDWTLRLTLTKGRGRRNACCVTLEKETLWIKELPQGFDTMRLLLVTDLHIDGLPELVPSLIELIRQQEFDLGVLGGDYSFSVNTDSSEALGLMQQVSRVFAGCGDVVGVLGNHDRYHMAQCLEAEGVKMLINEHICLEKGGDRLFITGLDDNHYYQADDIHLADDGIPSGACKCMVCHSPEKYREAAIKGYHLYLAGHTHGGQICLPGGFAPVTCATIPRKLTKGIWQYKQMQGYTSRGLGISSVPVRFFCPPEITLMTLQRV